jgi:hypothetical protein
VAYLNTFGYGQTAYYSPVFVCYNNLNSPSAVADAASHEMGHTVGLTHDGNGFREPGERQQQCVMVADHGS